MNSTKKAYAVQDKRTMISTYTDASSGIIQIPWKWHEQPNWVTYVVMWGAQSKETLPMCIYSERVMFKISKFNSSVLILKHPWQHIPLELKEWLMLLVVIMVLIATGLLKLMLVCWASSCKKRLTCCDSVDLKASLRISTARDGSTYFLLDPTMSEKRFLSSCMKGRFLCS